MRAATGPAGRSDGLLGNGMETAVNRPLEVDTGLMGLVLLARFHGIAAEPRQIQHQFGAHGRPLDSIDLVRAARALELKAREVKSAWARLGKPPCRRSFSWRTDGMWCWALSTRNKRSCRILPRSDRERCRAMTFSRREPAG